MRKEKSCGAIIARQASEEPEFLLIQHYGGHWGFPKGHVEAGETEQQTARREVDEETGVAIEFLDGFREEEVYAPAPGILKTAVYFLARSCSEEVRHSPSEIIDHAWLPLRDAANRLPFESQRMLLHRAHHHLLQISHVQDSRPTAGASAPDTEIQRLQAYLQNMINSMPSALIGVDRQGVVTQWNHGAEQLTGVLGQAAQGRTLAEIFPEFTQQLTLLWQAMHTQQAQKLAEMPYEIAGQRRSVDITVYPLVVPRKMPVPQTANGFPDAIEGAVIRIDDVTERTRLNELMVQTEKMMTVGRLAAGMAHEINNPLGVILQGLENIIRRFSPGNPGNQQAAQEAGIDLTRVQTYLQQRHIVQYIDDMRTAGLQASKIVADMLHFSRPSETSITLVDISQVVEHAIDLTASDTALLPQTSRKRRDRFGRIQLLRAYDAHLPKVRCIPNEIEQVLLNVLRNAVQAFGNFSNSATIPQIRIAARQDGDYARIEIADNGPGIEAADLERVFEPFYTTRPVGAGTGLGLSISYFIIVSHHHGEMLVNSEPGRGAAFIIRLPLNAAPSFP